jgi:hypothetical protein
MQCGIAQRPNGAIYFAQKLLAQTRLALFISDCGVECVLFSDWVRSPVVSKYVVDFQRFDRAQQ